MRMKAFKSHGMNRVVCRSVSHAVNDCMRQQNRVDTTKAHVYTNANTQPANSEDAWIGLLVLAIIILGFVVAPVFMTILCLIVIGIFKPEILFIGLAILLMVI